MTNSQFLYAYINWSRLNYHIPQQHHAITPETPCPMSYYLSCKNVQKTTCPRKHPIILYYYSMFHTRVYLHFQKWQSFPQGRDVFNSHVNLKIQLTHLHQIQSTHPTHISPHFINCVNFSHNSPKTPKITSILTSIKPLYFLVKLNCQTI